LKAEEDHQEEDVAEVAVAEAADLPWAEAAAAVEEDVAVGEGAEDEVEEVEEDEAVAE